MAEKGDQIVRKSRAPRRLAAYAWFTSLILGGPVVWSRQPDTPRDAPARPAEAGTSARLHEVFLREISDYDFYLDAEKRRKLELRREPVMRFTSPVDRHGEVYVWTDRGSAAVVGCVFSGPLENNSRRIMHEFHSLSPQPLASGSRGGTGWCPEEAGIRLEPIPDAPEPAGDEARRLTQMRNLARGFSADMMRQGVKWELRLLPQPLYRYEPAGKDSRVVDGALFAYVWTTGTDPEVFLIIEARRTDGGVSWQYAPARFTNREATVKYRGKEVWRADPASAGIFDGVTTKRYGAFSVKTVPDSGEAK